MAADPSPAAPRAKWSARAQAAGIAALGVFVFVRASRFTDFWSDPGSPGVFPALVAAVLLACAVSIWRQERSADEPAEPVTGWALLYAALIIGYGALLRPLGFVRSSLVFLLVSFLWLRAMPWWKSLLVAAVATGVTFAVFRYLFVVILP
ncbi:MAG TPA: tripartite tricarboxylate transporter TctB family protein [bacterium]|nr:tripartite tricarboxylate transporter TctB family protein [bacterium]